MLDMSGIPIYLLPGFSDLRRGINGFVSIITNIMEMDVTLGGLYIFCGRRRDSIKCVMWDKTGFLLLQKKLVGSKYLHYEKSECDAGIRKKSKKILTGPINMIL